MLPLLICQEKVSRYNRCRAPFQKRPSRPCWSARRWKKLGYDVKPPREVDYNVAYTSIASGDATFLAVNWDPLHADQYKAAGGDAKFYREGVYVSGAAQGYLIDKKTADKYHITNVEQLKDPKIAKLFDTNGDGKADMTGCTPGWGCEAVINHHLGAYGLEKTVTHNQGNYAAMIADTITASRKASRSCTTPGRRTG
ncbi:Glycine betaine-binding periplasmic protein precursor [Serratia rubidaea]|uniref:Glycine betaine-binding periplasmic protein n=1 Tax=Serratia rubidaea TaxID=61652 RepID=A0A3S5DF01_SERRU|nr:Glycine betaine-binding periplasmic protein precursor [Serratia rubidaea]